jgi:putative transposase
MATAKKRGDGDRDANYPRRKRSLVPSRYYAGTFAIEGRRLRFQVARGASPLVVRLARDLPYRDQIRSVTLLHDAGRLFVDITAEVAIAQPEGATTLRVAGIDLSIIHPYVVVSEESALTVSGRALRAESRLHLAEQKARRRAVASRAPAKGMKGSRRWRKYQRRTRTLEARHRRRLAQARHEAAKAVIDHATEHGIGTLVVGDPRGLLNVDAGARQNHAITNWRVGQWISTLKDKAEVAGIAIELVDERGTSSTCPRCHIKVPKRRGRNFTCPHCDLSAHRDVVGAANIAARSRSGGTSVDPSGLTIVHRRAGRNLPGRARRDRRRVGMQLHRRAVGPGPAVVRSVEAVEDQPGESLAMAVA